MRPFDVIVYGASGYTGRWIVEELLAARSSKERIAVAGRSAARVREALASHTPGLTSLLSDYCREQKISEIPVFECDSNNPASLEAMTSQAVVVISAAGPFNQFGMPLVDACVKTNTNYVDITGEPLFVERTHQSHHAAALKKNISIVNCCGFDCVPSDISVLEIQKRFPTVKRINGFLRSNAHGNTGTLFTAVEGIRSSATLRALRKTSTRPPLALSFKPRTIFRDSRMGWCAVFPGADPTIIRNSQIERKTLHNIDPVPVGLYFSCDALIVFLAIVWIGIVIYLASKFSVVERVLRAVPHLLTFGLFSDQPAPETLKTKYAEWTFLFELADGRKGEAVMRLKDPGYSATASLCVGCALTIVREKNKVVPGVVTTATAFGDTQLLSNIEKRGVSFKIGLLNK